MPELLDLVDANKLGESIGEILSFLSETEQQAVLSLMRAELRAPTKAQAQRIKQLHEDREFTEDALRAVFQSGMSKSKEIVSIPLETLERFFTEDETPAQMAEAIIVALEQREKLKAFFPKGVTPVRMTEVIVKILKNEKRRQRNKAQER